MWSLTPALAVVAVWRLSWVRGGFGAHGSGEYVDPLGDPVGFLRVLPGKLVMLLHGQMSVPPSDLAVLAPPWHQPFLLGIAVLTTWVVAWIAAPVVRFDRQARFWAAGGLLALLPLAASFPSDRLLLLAGIGAMGVLAHVFEPLVARLGGASGGVSSLGGRDRVVLAFLLLHGLGAPFLLAFRSAQMEFLGRAADRTIAGIPSDPSVREETVVVVASPFLLLTSYIQAERALTGVPRPRHLYVLASASSPVEVERTGPSVLRVRPESGFLYTPNERHYRGNTASLPAGAMVELDAMRARCARVRSDGRPAEVEFTFTDPGRTRFLAWKDGTFVPFVLPAVGERVTLPEEDIGRILLAAALH